MNIQLKYGKEQFLFTVPPSAVIPDYLEPEFNINREVFKENLLKFLPEEQERYKQVAVVVSDKTRLCGYPEYLPWLAEILMQRGAQKNNICFFIAYGTHPRQTEEESYCSYGDIYGKFRFVHHDCRDESLFQICGITQRGTQVTIRKDILRSTLVITFGAISHHYFAGYGGGRKLLFPGLGERKAIYHNHSLFLDRKTRFLAAGCQPGNLDGNPLAEDLEEIDTYMPSKVSIHGILNSEGKVCRLMAGDSYHDFVDACHVHDGFYRYKSDRQYDLVLASSGGYPKDINFIQAHKSLHHAAAFVKDGGKLVILSECIDNIGSDYFMQFIQAGSIEAAFAMLEKKYEGNGGTALSMMGKTGRIQVHMLTSLDADQCKKLGVIKVSADDIRKIISGEKGTISVIRNASVLVK
jgi:nickel-dependent lactate racemase